MINTMTCIMYIYYISSNVIKYGKLCTKDGHIISSKWISKDKIKSRNNYSVAVRKIFLNLHKLQNILIHFYIRLTSQLICMLIVLMLLENLFQKKYLVK